uniref:Regulator of nonsense transcripts 3A n=1 Tax=Culex pipiens TaxID=7175 RepID=A0A8D8FWA4_CULPI
MVVVESQKLPEGSGKESEANGKSAEAGTSGKAKSKKEKKDGGGKQREKKKAKKESAVKPLTKVVIRRLPPSMDEETFRKQIDPIPDHDDFYFVSGDWSLGKNASSRAYINFTRAEDIFLFKDKFDGYDFVDAKGVEYPAVVEFAPFQELPRNRSRKKDAKVGTIETDTHFVAFKEALEAEEKDTAGKSKSKLEYSYKIKDEKKITSTPLLEFIAQKKQEKRDEKRKKLEEKKKLRKEERQKKSQAVGKTIPEVIKEEKVGGGGGGEDEIVVRTVPSRLDPAQGKKEGGGGKEKEKRQRNRKDKDKEKDRPKPEKEEVAGATVVEPEKQLNRKQERDRMRKEKEKARKQEEREKKALAAAEPVKVKEKEPAPKVEVPKPAPPAESPPKKEVKKYSERRKETRARAETRLAELEERKDDDASTSLTSEHFQSIPNIPKIDIKKSVLTPHVAPFIPKEQKSSTIIVGSGSTLPPAFPQKSVTPTPPAEEVATAAPETPPAEDSSSCEKKHEIDEKLKEAREARKIRNKNRPSIEIYQPRKRLVPGSKEGRSEKSDSDRSSEQSARPGTSDAKGSAASKAKDSKRHKLTKKASDKERPRDRRSRRKNSSDAEMGEESMAGSVTEVVEALEGASLE